jgi:hypothetical protein
MNHIKYVYTRKLNEYFTNEKIQSYYIEYISKDIKQPILVKQHVQWNKVEYNVEINEHIRFSIYNDIYNKYIQNIPIVFCFCHERLCFLKQI